MTVSVHDRLEERANNRVLDEEPLCHELERWRAPEHSGVRHPRWCPDGLTKSQKRRVQRQCQWEQQQQEERHTLEKKKVKSQVQRAKPKVDDAGTSKSAADINMVFILPMEFMAPASDGETSDTEGGMAQLALDPMPTTFEKPEEEKRRHLKALFLKGQDDGRPVTKLLVDGGAAANIMSYAMFCKLGKGEEDLIKTDMMLKDFGGNVSPARGALCVDLTIGSKTLPATFFVVNGKGSYNLLLGCDWIHANCCIPSTMHQCVIQWVGDSMEIVNADSSFSIAAADAQQWSYEMVSCMSGKVWDTDFVKVSDFDLQLI
jgi:hypothetical protein